MEVVELPVLANDDVGVTELGAEVGLSDAAAVIAIGDVGRGRGGSCSAMVGTRCGWGN